MANRTKLVDVSELVDRFASVLLRPRTYIAGKDYNSLHVEEYAGHHQGNVYWWCRCVCGNRKIIRASSITSGNSKTCGDCPKATGNRSHAWEGCGGLSKNLFGTYRNHAKAKGFDFEITIEYAWSLFEKQGGRCAFTGWPLTFNKTFVGQADRTASLDRIDSNRGYVEGNLQWVHRDINRLKRNLSDARLLEICVAIARHRGTT